MHVQQSWLSEEIVRRWKRQHAGEFLALHELRTIDNVRLDPSDSIGNTLRDDETVICLLATETQSVRCGDMLVHYYLMDLIGEGTFGKVFRARDLNLNRHVAVKVLRKEKANKINTRRFMREAELNGALSHHPHVVTVHDFGRTATGALYIVMELLQGQPLNLLLDECIDNQTPFPALDLIHLCLPVLKGKQVSNGCGWGLFAFFFSSS